MERVWAPRFILISLLLLALSGCGDSGSNQAEQASQTDQGDQTEQIATADEAGQDEQAPAADVQRAAPTQRPQRQADARDQRPPAGPPPSRMQGPGGPGGPGYPPRHGATRVVGAGVRGDVGLFYDPLAQQGSWVRHPVYSYVWIPGRMGPGWRPYQEGHWVWTNDYGWYWDSDEPFAWATYHYGRWDYDPVYGWFWVPGDVWAPAWVTWRFGRDAVGWAPIAPDRPGYAVGAPTRYQPPIQEGWVFVDHRNFADAELGAHIVPMSRLGPTIDAAVDIRTPRYDNGRVTNMVIKLDEVQRFGGPRVETREIVYVGDRNDMFDDVQGARFGIYRPVINPGDRPAPPAVVDVTRVNRVVVQEYAAPAVSVTVVVPSAALLDVLDPNERQGLLQARLDPDQAALNKKVAKLRAERAQLIEQKRNQVAKLQAQLERERQQAMQQRLQAQRQLRAQRQQLAAKVQVDTTAPASADAEPTGKAPLPDAADAAPTAPAKSEAAAPAQADTESATPAEDARPSGKPKKTPEQAAKPDAGVPPTATLPTETVPPAAESIPPSDAERTGAVDSTPPIATPDAESPKPSAATPVPAEAATEPAQGEAKRHKKPAGEAAVEPAQGEAKPKKKPAGEAAVEPANGDANAKKHRKQGDGTQPAAADAPADAAATPKGDAESRGATPEAANTPSQQPEKANGKKTKPKPVQPAEPGPAADAGVPEAPDSVAAPPPGEDRD